MPNYIPNSDAAFDAWAVNFATLITANPSLYGIDPTDAATIQAAVDLYDAAYQIAGVSGTPPKTPLNPSQRTAVTIATKDSAKSAALDIVRFFGINIRNNVGVSNDDKTALGLTIVKTIPTPIPAPVTVPILTFVANGTNSTQFTWRDSGTPTVKRRPFGAVGVQLYRSFTTPAPLTPAPADFIGVYTKAPFTVVGDDTHAGDSARYWARWITQRQLVGDFSAPLDLIVPPGGT